MGTSSALPHETLPQADTFRPLSAAHRRGPPCSWLGPSCPVFWTWLLRPAEHTVVGLLLVLGPEWLVIYMNRRVVPRHVLVKLKDAEESENPA